MLAQTNGGEGQEVTEPLTLEYHPRPVQKELVFSLGRPFYAQATT